ncbi:MAG TPA: type II toxin-antitoxin system HicA family toxin [Thermosulfurimonas dismutans]|uniref:Type II toxin-antitoxin system HicA family toxin n=1 Tax=Thermosulfurimonas dismutans TaxID=999894 RepID=A0A7C3GCT1_9BACT|nr:type II toxin-antitoxin system HicA family toxin [Thermosulfurimonas dismutans]
MPKLSPLSAKEVCKILEKHGFKRIRKTGSHIVMQKKVGEKTVTVIVPDHKEIKKGTLRSIIRQSKLPREEFER